MSRAQQEALNLFLILIYTDSAEEFDNAYKSITGAGGKSCIYYLNKYGEHLQ